MIEGQEGVSWAQWRALADACEQYGVGRLYCSDHYLNLNEAHPERGSLDAWGTLCGLAAVTSNIRLGTLVSPVTFRHPSELAKLVTTVDHISAGRVELGIGAGWHRPEHESHGFEYYDTKTRMDILEEQLQVLRGNWGPAEFSLDAKHYKLTGLRAEPKPIQQPNPPIVLGGKAGPRGARLAARYADEYNVFDPTVEEAREVRDRLGAACEREGKAPLPLSALTVVITGETRAEVRHRTTAVAALSDRSADELLTNVNPAWIIGTLDQVAERLLKLAEVGVSRVMCNHFAPDDLEYVEMLAVRLAPMVA